MSNVRTEPAKPLTDLLFDDADVGLCLVAPDGTIVRVNAEWLRSTGFTEDEVLGEDLVALFPGTRDLALAIHARARAGHRVDVPRHAQVVNGRETWWEGTVEPVAMEGGTGLLISAREVRGEADAESAAELEAVLGCVASAVLVYDVEGRVVRTNAAAEALLGYDPVHRNTTVAERVANGPYGWVDEHGRRLAPDDSAAVRASRYGETHRGQIVGMTAPGSERPERWLSVSAAPFIRRGQRVGAVVSLVDVTKQKRAEEDLRETLARHERQARLFEGVASTTPDFVYVFDRQGRFLYANRRLLEVWGLPLQDAVGKTCRELGYEQWHHDMHMHEIAEVIATRRAIKGEVPFKAPLTGIFGVYEYIFTPVLGPDGEVEFIAGTTRDVTERKRAEESLAFVTRLYAVLTRVNEVIVRTHDEPTLYAELCRIVADSGFPLVWVGLVEGRAVTPVAAAGAASAYLREVKVELDGPLGLGPTGTCIREDRAVINDDFALNPATWPWREATARYGLRASAALPLRRDGRVIGAVTFYAARAGAFTEGQVKLLESLCADVSYALDALARERLRADAEQAVREANAQLRDADRKKDEFLGMLSHELRNPLAPIRNSTYILRHAEPGGPQARRAQEVIERQVEHVTRLVDDLLDVTRIARGKIELRRSRVDLRELVRRAVEDFRATIEDRGVSLSVAVPEARVWADADATRVTQVVGNLLHNAAKFTRRGDAVAVTLSVAGGAAEIAVRDTGAGIEPDLLPRVFEAFFQGERTLARTEGGLGLGLALVKGIAELHGGAVRADSAGKGRGAEFVVTLPVIVDTAPAHEPAAGAVRREKGGRRVLVVDDNRDAADTLAEIAAMLGHSVEVAYDGPSAVAKARASPPDVVLCDLGLPGMNGYEVGRALRADGRPVQLFAVTGYAQADDVKRAIEAGFDGHLAKPLQIGDLERLLA